MQYWCDINFILHDTLDDSYTGFLFSFICIDRFNQTRRLGDKGKC